MKGPDAKPALNVQTLKRLLFEKPHHGTTEKIAGQRGDRGPTNNPSQERCGGFAANELGPGQDISFEDQYTANHGSPDLRRE
jgi:hypothetical protein